MKKRGKVTAAISFRQALFWDVDPKKISPKKHAIYIIERILDFGNDKEVRWLFHYYSPKLIRKTLNKSRVIHHKSKALWQLLCN